MNFVSVARKVLGQRPPFLALFLLHGTAQDYPNLYKHKMAVED